MPLTPADSSGKRNAQAATSAENAETPAADPPHRKTTPLPLRQMVPMMFVLLNESLCQTMLLPFVGMLVAHLRGTSQDKAGYVSGVLIGTFMLGQVLSGKKWGSLSDKYGRRFPLITGMVLSSITMLGFGLSPNVWYCALFRFLHGLFNGNVLVAKTMMSEITGVANRAKGFAFVSFCFGVGTLVGPLIGGILYDPTSDASALAVFRFSKTGVFARFPALLPSLLIFCYSIVGVCTCTFFVQESNLNAQPLPRVVTLLFPCLLVPWKFFEKTPLEAETNVKDVAAGERDREEDHGNGTQPGEEVRRGCDGGSTADSNTTLERESPRMVEDFPLVLVKCEAMPLPPAPHACGLAGVSPEQSTTPLAACEQEPTAVSLDGRNDSNEEVPPGRTRIAYPTRDGGTIVMTFRTFGYHQAFRYPPTRFLLITYLLTCAGAMIFDEILPLWLIATRSSGGVGYTPQQVSYLLIFNGIPTIASNMIFHPLTKRYVDKMQFYRHSQLLTGIAFALTPFASYLPSGWPQAAVVIVCSMARMFTISWSYGLITMLTAISAPKGHIGNVMGVNQSVGCATRGIVPLIAAPIFAWSISNPHVPPFNHLLTFFMGAIIMWISCCWSFTRYTDEGDALHVKPNNTMARVWAHLKRTLCIS